MALGSVSRKVSKPTLGHVRPTKIQISLHIRTVCSDYSLGSVWVANDAKVLQVDTEDSDRISWMHRLIWVVAGRTSHHENMPI